MTIFQAGVLGVVQGLTEFLPISSSGHLALFQHWFGLQGASLEFDVAIHLATLVAILLFFGRSLFKVTFKEWLLLAVGTVPAVIVTIVAKDKIEALFAHDRWVGVELIISGLINFYIDWRSTRLAKLEQTAPAQVVKESQISWWQSFKIGIAQAVAIIPGISRSGSTVAAAMGVGLSREAAFRFSFLLAIPALTGAGLLQAVDIVQAGSLQVELVPTLVGCLMALVTGIASLALFRYVIAKAQLQWFGWYCVVLGVVATWWIR